MGTGMYVAFMLLFSYVLNVVFGGYDNLLLLNMASTDTVQHINVMVDIWKLSPAIFFVGLVWWVIERAKGTNITPELFYIYEGVLFMSILYSFVMLISIGTSVDVLQRALFSDQILSMVEPKLMTAAGNLFFLGIKLVYAYCMWPGYAGCLLFILHPNTLQTDTLFGPVVDNTGAGVTDWENM